MTRVAARRPLAGVRYSLPEGVGELRRQIAFRAHEMGCQFAPEELLVTSGATEGLATALQLVARSGDAVAVESPCYFQILQLIESLGMLAVEVRTDADSGMDLKALERALDRVDVKAVITVTNFHNPLGGLMPEASKRALVTLLEERQIPLIEDDVYGDLHFDEQRPWVAKAFDETGNVILCSSFSKTLAPGYRVGWMAPGRFMRQAATLKRALSGTTASLTQLAVSEFLATGAYDRTLRSVRRACAHQVDQMRFAVAEHFPHGTRISHPAGGFVLWVELPGAVDSEQLFHAALDAGVSITPGTLFTATRRFRNYIRLSAGLPFEQRVEDAVATVGRLATELC
jgi:DNA-binding transcriptional MocR family regulator